MCSDCTIFVKWHSIGLKHVNVIIHNKQIQSNSQIVDSKMSNSSIDYKKLIILYPANRTICISINILKSDKNISRDDELEYWVMKVAYLKSAFYVVTKKTT